MTVNLAFRGYVNGELTFEEFVSLEHEDGSPRAAFDEMTLRHFAIMQKRMKPGDRHLVEVEFLDETDQAKRFFRLGSDPSMMREPLAVDPGRPQDALAKWKGR